MTIGSQITVTIYSNRDEHAVSFPAKWSICPYCEGSAVTSRGVECDGGGFTASEWNEQDEDFRQDYLAGVYDRPCEPCKGLGRVQVIDRKAVHGWRQKLWLRAYDRQIKDEREILALEAAERRMGA